MQSAAAATMPTTIPVVPVDSRNTSVLPGYAFVPAPVGLAGGETERCYYMFTTANTWEFINRVNSFGTLGLEFAGWDSSNDSWWVKRGDEFCILEVVTISGTFNFNNKRVSKRAVMLRPHNYWCGIVVCESAKLCKALCGSVVALAWR